jgi:membrane-bound lytic murein transglycosylase D
MEDRTKTFFSFFVFAAAGVTGGCGYPQQSKFQMSFLPAPPSAAVAAAETPAPEVTLPNRFLEQVPTVLLGTTRPPRRYTKGDATIDRAETIFQQAKKTYQNGNIPEAREKFDLAIDLMLQASEQDPSDRAEFENLLEGMVDGIHRFDLTGLGASALLDSARFEKAPLEDILQMTFPVDPKLKERVRGQLSSISSQLPLSLNDTVLGYINYFANRGHATILAATRRSGRYRPMIQRILQEEGIPPELLHLAQAESGFIPRAVSRKAAGGMWQFLAWRGQQYGLMQTRFTDDRMDPEKATRAAARHLHDLYAHFGDWYLAIAAYNCGPGAVESAVERTGYADFWELRGRGALPAETTNYVPIILAMTIMEKNAAEYGLDGIELDPPLQYDTISVASDTSLQLVSDILDTPVSELASLNPALLKGIAPVRYELRVPKGTSSQVEAMMKLVPAERRASWRLHRIGGGETLASIGRQYGVAPALIASANNLRPGEELERERLVIPAFARAESVARPVASRAHKATVQRKSHVLVARSQTGSRSR